MGLRSDHEEWIRQQALRQDRVYRDQRISNLEATVTALRARLVQLEKELTLELARLRDLTPREAPKPPKLPKPRRSWGMWLSGNERSE